jgi:hypothetical protein
MNVPGIAAWNNRGWTFQDRLLSRVYFECRNDRQSENQEYPEYFKLPWIQRFSPETRVISLFSEEA